jgi:NAD(P)H-hydrate repair Nnr-like enzyme with NAD(P)H-hydrate dehydratase domain
VILVAFEQTSFTIDLIGRFVCNTWDDAVNSVGSSFDVVVIGAGMHGGYCAEKIYRFAKESGKKVRILVLDAGSLLLTEIVNVQPAGGKCVQKLVAPGIDRPEFFPT